MTHSFEFILLAVTKVGDNSLVLHTLSGEWGRRSFITGIRKGASLAMFLPMNILEGVVTENPRSELWRMGSITACHSLSGIRGDVKRNTMTLFMSEVLFRIIKDGASEEGLFQWCRKSILMLDALDQGYANFHLRWLLELAAAMGFSPSLGDLAPFAEGYLKEMRELLQRDFAGCMMLPLSGAARNRIAEILIRYIDVHAECNITVRSLAVLRELYS